MKYLTTSQRDYPMNLKPANKRVKRDAIKRRAPYPSRYVLKEVIMRHLFTHSTLLACAMNFAIADDAIPHDHIQVDHIMKQFWLRVESGDIAVAGETLERKDLDALRVIFEQPVKPMLENARYKNIEEARKHIEEQKKEIAAGGGFKPSIKVEAKLLRKVLTKGPPDSKVCSIYVTLGKDGNVRSIQPSICWTGED